MRTSTLLKPQFTICEKSNDETEILLRNIKMEPYSERIAVSVYKENTIL